MLYAYQNKPTIVGLVLTRVHNILGTFDGDFYLGVWRICLHPPKHCLHSFVSIRDLDSPCNCCQTKYPPIYNTYQFTNFPNTLWTLDINSKDLTFNISKLVQNKPTKNINCALEWSDDHLMHHLTALRRQLKVHNVE